MRLSIQYMTELLENAPVHQFVARGSVNWDPKTGALVLAVGSALLALYAAYLWLRVRSTWSWRPVSGQITHSPTDQRDTYRTRTLWRKKVPVYRPDVQYVYSVDGIDHQSTRIFFGDGAWYDSQNDAAAIVARYPPGQSVRVYCSPSSPDLSVLERGEQAGARRYVMLAGKLLGLALVLWVLSAY